MRPYLYFALVVVAIALALRGRRRRLPEHDTPLPRPHWETWEIVPAGIGFAAALVLAYVRLQYPYVAREGCGATFGSILEAGGEHGLVYMDAIVILALPPLVVGWVRRDARWAIAGLLLILAGFAACWEASARFHCPPGL